MVENAFAEIMHVSQPMRGGEIDPRLPFLDAAFAKRLWRNPELHAYPPVLSAPGRGCCLPFAGDSDHCFDRGYSANRRGLGWNCSGPAMSGFQPSPRGFS